MEGTLIIKKLMIGEGNIIGKLAIKGNIKAENVMKAYKFWRMCPGDNVAKVLFEEAYENYRVGEENESSKN